jgi:hypothetical protein
MEEYCAQDFERISWNYNKGTGYILHVQTFDSVASSRLTMD